jgi:hypothetical protein
MTADVASTIIAGTLPLVAAGLGAAATIAVQHGTAKAANVRFAAETRASHREELKTAVLDYLNHAQRLQGQLDARERGEPAPKLKRLVEKLWLHDRGCPWEDPGCIAAQGTATSETYSLADGAHKGSRIRPRHCR